MFSHKRRMNGSKSGMLLGIAIGVSSTHIHSHNLNSSADAKSATSRNLHAANNNGACVGVLLG